MTEQRMPLPRHIEAQLRSQIVSGEYQAGQQLPSEDELARAFGVSRATMREAVASLALQGYLIKRRGVGTFVGQSQAIAGGLESLISITEWIRQSGYVPGTAHVAMQARPANTTEREIFAPWRTRKVVEIHRVRTADDIPVLYCIDIIPENFAPHGPGALQESLLTFLEEEWGQVVIFAQTTIDVDIPTKEMSQHLHISLSKPLLCLRQMHYNQHSTVVLLSRDHFIPEYFRFDVRRHRQ